MTTCSTWHVRIDLVGEDEDLVARVKLVGAPAVEGCPRHTPPDRDCPDCRDPRAYTGWHDLPDTLVSLLALLEGQHRSAARPSAPTGPAAGSAPRAGRGA